VSETLAAHRSILIPCDASARVIELLVLLSQHWAFSRIGAPLCLVSHTAKGLPLAISNQQDFLAKALVESQASQSLALKCVHA
jgi:cleavage and polyadenylation specificity factor subunit 2